MNIVPSIDRSRLSEPVRACVRLICNLLSSIGGDIFPPAQRAESDGMKTQVALGGMDVEMGRRMGRGMEVNFNLERLG